MFAIMMWVFLQTLNLQQPRWRLDKSLIGTNPGKKIESIDSEQVYKIGKPCVSSENPVVVKKKDNYSAI